MKSILLSILVLSALGCAKQKGEDSPFEGVWLGEEIQEFRANKSEHFICDRVEKVNDRKELTIDGFNINGSGDVSDFTLHDDLGSVRVWVVHADGSTSDNLLIQNNDKVDGDYDVLDVNMKKTGEDTLSTLWKLRNNDRRIVNTEVKYVRSNTDEVSVLRAIVNRCP